MWPLSFIFASNKFSQFYLNSWDFFGGVGTLLHLTITAMTWYSMRMYLYESAVTYKVMQYETIGYNVVIYGIFRLS